MKMYWLRQRIHLTWHLTACVFGIVAGVCGAQWWEYFGGYWWLLLGCLLFLIAAVKQYRAFLILACIGGVLIGLARGGIDHRQLHIYDIMQGKHVQITGVIADDTQIDKRGRIIIELGSLSSESRKLPGEIRLAVSGVDVALRRSDEITVHGILKPGFGRYAATMDATISRVGREQGADIALDVRDQFSAKLKGVIHEPAASLGIGYLLGQKQALPADLQDALQVVGLTHIVVASGYNLTILVRLARRLLQKHSRYMTAVVGMGLVLAFITMTGLSPSITRAGLVTMLSLVAWYVGRRFHPTTLLGIVAAVTVLWDPRYAWGDVGWLLSFAAFAGVMILAPILQAYFFGDKKPSFVAQVLIETSSAQLLTAPIIMATFGTFSNIALVANIIVVPIVPLTMLFAFIAGITAWLPAVLAAIGAWPAQTILDATIGGIRWFADLPGAQSTVSMAWWGYVGWYVLLGILWWYMRRATAYRLRNTSIVE